MNISTKVSALTNDTFRPTYVGDNSKTARDQRAMNVRILATLKSDEIARKKAAEARMKLVTIVAGFLATGLLSGVIVGAAKLAVYVAPYLSS